VLPWGNVAERARSETLAAQIAGAIVAPALGLEEAAALLAGAHAVVGLDTGLTHLAAALDAPTVGIYCATDPLATGVYGCPLAMNLGGIDRLPEVREVTTALDTIFAKRSANLSALSPGSIDSGIELR
jgi:heptosyltransferase-1